MGKQPAFQLYAADLLTDVMDWTDEQVGAHIRLLCWSWVNRRGIPRDTQRLTRISPAAAEAWPVIGTKWVEGPDDTWVNERLESTRAESDAYRASQRERSLLAVAARASKASPMGKPKGKSRGKPKAIPKDVPLDNPIEGEEEDFISEEKERATVELKWPPWAGERTRAAWRDFQEYRWVQHRAKYVSVKTEQMALDKLAQMFPSGPEFVAALEYSAIRNWQFPVSPTEFQYPPLQAAQDQASSDQNERSLTLPGGRKVKLTPSHLAPQPTDEEA